MKRLIYAAAAALFGVTISYAGESALDSLRASVSPSVLGGMVLPDVSGALSGPIKGNPGFNGHGQKPYTQGANIRCAQARTMDFLSRLENPGSGNEPATLARVVCRFSNDPTQTVKYPDGAIAYVGPEYSDKGSWKYPNGTYAFVGESWSDKGSWKYPSGSYALVGDGWSDKGSWKYPSGKYAFVGEGYSDKGSWKYPNGSYALVGEGWSDKDSWKYPSGKYAFVGEGYSDKGSWKYPTGRYAFAIQGSGDSGTWYYPNGNLFASGNQGEGISVLTQLVEDTYNIEFPYNIDLYNSLDGVNTMYRLQWIEQTMPTSAD
ncbi:MAG: hypothetical protein NTX59_00690 [Elusimicrobia bacterium]|nr:hypothetical protein [Elusimicrobiota bacterium]